MPFSRDVSDDNPSVRQPNFGNFPQRRIWFLRCHGSDNQANPSHHRDAYRVKLVSPFERVIAPLERQSPCPFFLSLATMPNQLVDCRHITVAPLQTNTFSTNWPLDWRLVSLATKFGDVNTCMLDCLNSRTAIQTMPYFLPKVKNPSRYSPSAEKEAFVHPSTANLRNSSMFSLIFAQASKMA